MKDERRDIGATSDDVSGPFRQDDEEDRVRAILEADSNDDLPDVDEDTLLHYHRYLAGSLQFPFDARASEDIGFLESRSHRLKILGLVDPDEYDVDEFQGLFCHAREGKRSLRLPLGELEVSGGGTTARLVNDYRYWFWNCR